MSNDIGKTLNFVSQKDIANNQPSPCWDHFISEHSWHFQVSLFVLIILEPQRAWTREDGFYRMAMLRMEWILILQNCLFYVNNPWATHEKMDSSNGNVYGDIFDAICLSLWICALEYVDWLAWYRKLSC